MGLDRLIRSGSAAGKLRATRMWTGQMIAPDCDGGQGTRASFVVKTFDLEKVPGRQRRGRATGSSFLGRVERGIEPMTVQSCLWITTGSGWGQSSMGR